MAQQIYLESGHASKGDLRDVDSSIVNSCKNKNIFVIDLSFKEKLKSNNKKDFFNGYWNDLGAKNVSFISDYITWQEDYQNSIDESGILYLPGGDEDFLISNINEKGLVEKIKSFNGTIVGNSAGACALSKFFFKPGIVNMPRGLGIVDMKIFTSYDESCSEIIKSYSRTDPIYAIPEKSALFYEKAKKVKAVKGGGQIYLFHMNNKEMIKSR